MTNDATRCALTRLLEERGIIFGSREPVANGILLLREHEGWGARQASAAVRSAVKRQAT
jgi:putative component of toxin-antitoxin plasmid stabilization module